MAPTKPRTPGDWENLPHGLGRLGPRVSKPATSHQSLVPIKTESKWVAAEAEHTKEEVKKSGLEDAKEIDQVLGLSNRELNDTIEATLDDMISEASETKKSATTPKAPGKKKQQYRLDYKNSPYPNHPLPNPDACEEVHLILVGEHGAVVQPATIPPPSREVAGCGEVPDILDAILRTVLSANTSMGNSNKALAGLIAAFPHEDTIIDWNAVRLAAVKCVYDAIKCGGLANVKSSQIKKLLDIVFQQNIDRRAALIEEEKTGIPAELVGIEGLTKQQKAEEVSRIAKNPLTLDWIFEIKDTSKVMDELIKLPAVGIKTASCVILFNMRRPSFAVDTHVWRLCRYLGWAPVTANPNQTFNHCDLRVPDHLKYALHQLFICHGQKCHRCNAKTNAGTSEWNNSICVLEQLVTRMEAKKQPDYKPSAKDIKDAKREEPSEVEDGGDVLNNNKKKKIATEAKSDKRKAAEDTGDSSDVVAVPTKRVKRGGSTTRKTKVNQDDEGGSDYEASQKRSAKGTRGKGKKASK